jgi:ABC-type antimicrobial peptide transport system, permease component
MLKSWRRYARFFGPDVDRDVEEELRFHVDALVDEYVARGLPRTAAEAAARERLGDLRMIERHLKAHDRSRVRRSAWADTIPALWRDIRLALRSLRRSPTFTAATIAILAIAIGMSTAMSTIFKTVLIDRLPVIAQDRLVVMHPLDRRGTHLDVPYPYLAEMARDTAVFRGVAGVYHLGAQSVPFMSQGSPVQLNMASASPNYFDVFGLRPAAGRLFRREDGQAGAPVVMVLSYAAWRQRFGGDPHAIGRTLIDPYTQQPVRIVGVAPPGFEYPTGAEAWEQVGPDFTAQVDIIARLSPGVTTDAARAALFAMAQRSNPFVLEAPHKPIAISGVAVQGFTDTVLGSSRPALVALMLAVALLLVIACINVGNLVLVRLMSRHREIAVRRAIGASSGDIARLFGVESAILGIAGGLLGLGMAFVTLRVVSAAGPVSLPRADALGVAQAPLGVAALITVVAMLAFGLGPSLIASRVTSYSTLRSDSRSGTEGTARRRTRRWLVAWQMALAVVMLTGASLLVRTLARLQSVDLGYTPEHLSLLAFTGPRSVLAT